MFASLHHGHFRAMPLSSVYAFDLHRLRNRVPYPCHTWCAANFYSGNMTFSSFHVLCLRIDRKVGYEIKDLVDCSFFTLSTDMGWEVGSTCNYMTRLYMHPWFMWKITRHVYFSSFNCFSKTKTKVMWKKSKLGKIKS